MSKSELFEHIFYGVVIGALLFFMIIFAMADPIDVGQSINYLPR